MESHDDASWMTVLRRMRAELYEAPPPVPWRRAVSIGAASALAGGGVMALIRWVAQVRSLPERLIEWLLLFVPIDLFGAALGAFGFEAKVYALYGAVVTMLAALSAIGAVVLRRRLSPALLLALGPAIWLITMVVVMPLTGGGLFGSALIGSGWSASLGYLASALVFGAVLALAAPATSAPMSAPAAFGVVGRRTAIGTLGGAAVALSGAILAAGRVGSTLPQVVVLDPQEPIPSGGLAPLRPHPEAVATPLVEARAIEPTALASPLATSTSSTEATAPVRQPAVPSPTPTRRPEPAARQLARDKDGAVLPAGRKPGDLAPFITQPGAHYVVSKNPVADPELGLSDWRLLVDGDVNRPIQIDYASLSRLPTVEATKTLECISNFVAKCELAPFGCDLISTATWRGVRLMDVVGLAGGLKPGVVALAAMAADEFTTALPIEAAMAPDTLLVFEMNGEPLPREHGYPVRLLVPGRYGLKNTKWVVALRPMRREFVDFYGQRNWSKTGVVKTMTRIDTPAAGALVPPGDVRVAGIAYAADRGIARVEYTIDGGKSWSAAELLDKSEPGRDVWVRWEGKVTIQPGAQLTVVSRAADLTGAVQPEEFQLPQPDGGSGWHGLVMKAKG
jgi:DMSO/TMAO reductase YedYZ molybdopterin-dependent catalytic subunit